MHLLLANGGAVERSDAKLIGQTTVGPTLR